MRIRDEIADPAIIKQRLDQRDQHHIIRAHQFDHGFLLSQFALQIEHSINEAWQGWPTNALGALLGFVTQIEKSRAEPSLDALVALTRADMGQVNDTILSRTGSDVTMIPEVANHLIESGGKRLRPMLTLAAAALCQSPGTGHIKLAASVEFMHTATLLHDDVVDESDMRRGKPAARKLWGNQASVLVGDFLLGQAFRMMVEVGSLPCLDELSSAAAIIAEGEVMQLAAAKNLGTNEATYLEVIRSKTAALFSAACAVGALLAERGTAELHALRHYGTCLGLAFQLIDDALDYGGNALKLGKNVGDDFREGKITLPVIIAYEHGDASERAFWARTLDRGTIENGDLEIALAMLARHEALSATIAKAQHFGDEAIAALRIFPASALRDALEDAVHFCISRAH